MNEYEIIKTNGGKHKKDILPILERNLEDSSSNRYNWNYENCPYGVAHSWLARCKKSGNIVGLASLFTRKLIIKNKPLFAAIAGDFAVDKEHRVYGPSVKLQKEIQLAIKNNDFKFIYGIPNEQSRMLFLRLGYKEIGKFNRYIKIIKMEKIPEEYLPKYLHSKNFSKIVDFLIKGFSKEKRYKRKTSYTVETPEFFDDRFDVFWEKVSKQYSIIGEKTSEFLNWRYDQISSKKYNIFCLLDDKEIKGFLVYFVKNNICHIVDMLFDKSDEVVNSLLAEFVYFARKKEISSIVVRYLGNRFFENKLKKFNFFMTKHDDLSVVIYNSDDSLETYLQDGENWHFFTGDNDV